ncbi:protein dif-1-like [Diaphorina citri]|uniref:Protein dif-1-like n=1 Tax=Diaphorina citri TaxID=121845 RepID=A0A1S4EJP9_DIACI|nr:protein dif-1-like [Diaphorina citri]
MLDCVTKILQKEKIFGFYKGMGAPLVGVAPLNALNYFGYGTGLKFFTNEKNMGQLELWQYFLSGSLGGIVTAALVAPGERIKCLLQVQEGGLSNVYSGPVDVIRKLIQQHGLGSVFKGFSATLLRDVPAFGAYYAMYETVKHVFSGQGDSVIEVSDQTRKTTPLVGTITAGSMAGISYWIVAMPADVLKTRLQTAPEDKYPHGIRSVLSEMLEREGPRTLEHIFCQCQWFQKSF